MDYGEAYSALEEFVETEAYKEFEEELGVSEDAFPDVETFDDRAIIYVQVEDSFNGEYERKVLAEYRNGEFGPVPFDEEILESRLQGGGDVNIDESLLEPKDINFPEQRKAR